MKPYVYKYILLALAFCSCATALQSQSRGVSEMDRALSEKDFGRAEAILQPIVRDYLAQKNADSLVPYIYYVAKINEGKSGLKYGIKQMELFSEKIKTLSVDPATLRQMWVEKGEYYGTMGLNDKGYHCNEEALRYTRAIPGKSGNDLAMIENNLSTFAQRLGNINLAQQHTRSAISHLLGEKNPNVETLYISYNGMGAIMWYSSKIDSAFLYFQKALATLGKTERNAVNQFYRTAMLQNNLAGIYQLQGNTAHAMEALKTTIHNLKIFMASDAPDNKKVSAVTLQLEATDNLAGIYKELGNLTKARELLEHAYQEKQQHLREGNPGIFISQILLGQIYFALRDYDKASLFLRNGLHAIAASGARYMFWQADACNTLALLYEAKKDIKQAAFFYEKSDSLYERSLQGAYDNIYLDFLRNAALFYAANQQPEIAKIKAMKGYDYVVEAQGPNTLTAFYQLLNLSEVYFLAGNYRESLDYSKRGLAVVDEHIRASQNLLDSIRMELKKPRAILQMGKASYELLTEKKVGNIQALLGKMNAALSILERQKSILTDPFDQGILVSDHAELLEFIKKLNFYLYAETNDPSYIGRIVGLHESGLYNRIRSRLDKNDTLQYANVPRDVILREQQLNVEIAQALSGDGSHDEKIQRYFAAIDKRHDFQESLRKNQPKYYNLRYASIFKSVDQLSSSIPAKTTLIRYFFIDDKLYALVADDRQEKIVSLKADLAEKYINDFQKNGTKADRVSESLYALYRTLWLPIEQHIRHKRVVIIPDGILFNFNFELLTPQKIRSFEDLATKSLLAEYTISYHYSLFVLQKQQKTSAHKNGFIAFAPGFTDQLKENYQSVASKSAEGRDNQYLALLPQPFAVDLVEKSKKLFGGRSYVHEASTKNTFTRRAGNHQIIHIGTHAESNNDQPEFSRLIFAKNITEGEENNSLFVEEIYNCNLNSNLTVLTACESGRPGFQDGEGMISLANAFNYAGSESILMGLWKIDEQASAILMEYFYQNLLQGMPKDEALRQAKLHYLKTEEGRMLAPPYWAGLVLMGDTSPVQMKTPVPLWRILMIAGMVLLIAGGFIWRKKIVK